MYRKVYSEKAKFQCSFTLFQAGNEVCRPYITAPADFRNLQSLGKGFNTRRNWKPRRIRGKRSDEAGSLQRNDDGHGQDARMGALRVPAELSVLQ